MKMPGAHQVLLLAAAMCATLWPDRARSAELPVADAGPGYLAEPLGVTTTMAFYFSDGTALKNAAAMLGFQPAGTVVRAKLYAPRGRTFLSVSDVRVTGAVDDRGREVPLATGGRPGGFASIGNPRTGSAQFTLNLELPAPDARSIERLDAEAVVETALRWNEMILTNALTIGTNSLDAVLPGARLVLTNTSPHPRQMHLQAQITGPPGVRQMELRVVPAAGARINSSASERGTTQKDGETIRSLQLYIYGTGAEGVSQEDIHLVVRCPDEVTRERVKFTLKALDLF